MAFAYRQLSAASMSRSRTRQAIISLFRLEASAGVQAQVRPSGGSDQ